MTEKVQVETSVGMVTLKEPKTKHMKLALEEAETNMGQIKLMKLMNVLVPLCIEEHPAGNVNNEHFVDDLPPSDYMKLINSMKSLLNLDGDAKGE